MSLRGISAALGCIAGVALISAPLNDACAITVLKDVQVTKGSGATSGLEQIEITFDREIDRKQIQTELFRDIIQLSLRDVAVYPAKIVAVSGKNLSKVFAYQYTPKLVRFRMTVNGKAEDYDGRFLVEPRGKVLSLRFVREQASQDRDKLVVQAAQALRAAPQDSAKVGDGSSEPKAPESHAALGKIEQREQALLKNVLESDAKKNGKPATGTPLFAESTDKNVETTSKPSAKSAMSAILRSIGWMFMALIALIAAAVLVKKIRSRRMPLGDVSVAGVSSFLRKIGTAGSSLGVKLGIKRDARMIEVVSNHYLGPKKSIAVVRIRGKLLVVGITNDSINLITQLDSGSESPESEDGGLDTDPEALLNEFRGAAAGGVGARSAGPAVFANAIDQAMRSPASPSASSSGSNSAREKIRKRMEGMKVL